MNIFGFYINYFFKTYQFLIELLFYSGFKLLLETFLCLHILLHILHILFSDTI